jgi:iron complex transport system ATP-binding protein
VSREPTSEEVAAALAASSRVGLYFAVSVGRRPEPAPGPAESARSPFRTLADFYANRDLLDAALGDMAARLGCGERRVAASTLYLGHAARVWSVALGSWAVGGVVPHLAPGTVCWNVAAGRPTELVVTAPTGRRVSPADVDADVGAALEAVTAAVVDAHLRPFADVLRRATGTAAGLLWGNAASALVGAVQVLDSRRGPGPGSPGPGPDGVVPPAAVDAARRLAARLLERPPLAGTTRHRVDADGRLVLRGVVRRSCCLFYRVPDGGTCGDCPLTASPAAARRRERR